MQEIVNKVISQSGLAAAAHPELLKSLESSAPVSIRLNPHKCNFISEDNPIPWCSTGRYLKARPNFALDPLWHAGAYYVQEASSMFTGYAFEKLGLNQSPLPILDLCAAPGGKSTHLASLMATGSLLIANETIPTRASILLENLIKWGNPDTWVTQNDPADFKAMAGLFGLVVVDAPCSGEGLFRKDPDSIKQWNEALPQMCALRQKRILHEAIPLVAAGGYLFYSTCTFNRLENEEQLALIKSAGLESSRIEINPQWGIEEVYENGCYAYRFWPHRLQGEGFFFAAFKKPGEFEWPELSQSTPAKRQRLPKPEAFVRMSDEYTLLNWKNDMLAHHVAHSGWHQAVYRHLRPRRAALLLGETKGSDFVPSHEFAMSNLLSPEVPRIELPEDAALEYLRRNNVTLPDSDHKGWVIATANGIPLGWIKILSGRINNYYPKEYRLRSS